MSVNILYIDPVGNHSDEKSLFYSRESAAGTSISRHRQWNQHFWLLFALCFSTFSWICSFNVRNNIEKTVLEWLSGIYIYIYSTCKGTHEYKLTNIIQPPWEDYDLPETNSLSSKILGLKMTFLVCAPSLLLLTTKMAASFRKCKYS